MDITKLCFRTAIEKDIEIIAHIIKAAIAEMEKKQIFQWDHRYPTREDFLLDCKKKQLFVGILENDIAVVFAINREYDEQYKRGIWKYPEREYRIIHRLCVNPKYQNQGIARLTLEYVEAVLRNSGIEAIRLDVFGNNPFALALYHHHGYEKAGMAQWRKGQFYLMEKYL